MPSPTASVVDDSHDDFLTDLDLEATYAGHTCIDLIARLTECHYKFYYCTRYLAGQGYGDAGYGEARALLDCVLLHLYKAKWLIGGITGSFRGVRVSQDKDKDARLGWDHSGIVLDAIAQIESALTGKGNLNDIDLPALRLDTEGTETLRAGGFPIVPSICPVIVLRGSSYAMGYQYAEQVLEIFGDFVFREFASLRFSDSRLQVLRRHEDQIRQFTPEILDMCRGWADAVTASGLPMTYEHVLHLWCSTDEPPRNQSETLWPFLGSEKLLAAMYFGQQAFINAARKAEAAVAPIESPLEHCSGFCAWGSATTDGRLYASSSTDHDCWMQVTIVAYPDEGHAFIYTPFSVHGGWIPGLGLSAMGGHPGMNNRGLAYVHHGGEVHAMEPENTWGYGLPRGASIFHNLRYGATADAVHELTMSYPIGNIGVCMGSVGGQWADQHSGYVYESRHICEEHPEGLVRRGTFDHDGALHDMLYTGNSALHADAPSANHFHADGVLDYDIERGWHTYDASQFADGNLMIAAGRMTAGAGGAERNKCFFELAVPASGSIDEEWVTRLYRTEAADVPPAREAPVRHAAILASTYRAPGSPAHRGNAFTAVISPDNGDQGLYHGCVGPLRYDLPSNSSTHGYYYYDETNTGWTLRLATTAEDMLADAAARARQDGDRARQLVAKLDARFAGKRFLERFMGSHDKALEAGDRLRSELKDHPGRSIAQGPEANAYSGILARALRCVTAAQVRARQVIEGIEPPASLRDRSYP